MKVKHNKQNSETLNRLRDQSRNLNPDQLRQFIHKELEKKTRVRDINEALNIPRATVYRIKKNPTLKAQEIIFENQELVQEIFQECIKKFQNHYSFFESQDSDNFIDQNVFSQQIPACSQLYQQINYQSLEYLDQEDQLHYYLQNSQFQNSHSDNHQYENQILDFEMNQIYTSELNQKYLNTEESHFLSKNQSWQFY
ncbi:hypothetical protein ABPG72_012321 [Tetrahymena utriculariae]